MSNLDKKANYLRKRGLELLRNGNLKDAREHLLKASELYKRASKLSGDSVTRKFRLKRAEECEVLVKEIEKKLGVGESAEGSEKGDEYESYIKSLMVPREEKDKLPSWDDIGGLEDVKKKLKTYLVLSMIKDKPKAIKGDNIILYGPPGTGKTLLASAIARSLDATFFNVKISDLMSKYYGETTKILSALFKVAREYAPSIIFIDEVDSILMKRTGELDEETRRVQSTLLAEMDGLSKKGDDRPVIVIGATNLIERIDPAFLRPGRFGIQIEVPLPDYEACKEIIKIHTVRSGIEIDESLIDELAKLCVEKRMSGADIKGTCMKAIWKMLMEMNPDLERLADEPKEVIEKYKLRLRKLKREDFDV